MTNIWLLLMFYLNSYIHSIHTLHNYWACFRLQDLNEKIAVLNTSKDTLERMCFNARDEIQDITAKLENVSLEVKDTQGELKVQSKMMETRVNQLVCVEFYMIGFCREPQMMRIYAIDP